MFKLFVIVSIIFALVALFTYSWVPAVLYTFFSVLQPQYIWFWAFDGIPAFKIYAGLAIIAWLVSYANGKIDLNVYKLPTTRALVGLAVFFNLSHFLAPYPGSIGADIVLDIFNTTLFLYLICLGLITNEQAIKYLCYAFTFTGIYYGYDGNSAYFNSDWDRFEQGRLGGPSDGAYSDNNKFAILLVITFPFLLFGFFFFKNVFIKSLMVIGMICVMHTVFLTGSRGALLAIGASIVIAGRGIDSKLLKYAILAAFVAVAVDQAGSTLYRTKDIVENRDTQQPVNPRILSWTVGLQLMGDYPILGVGVHRFLTASAMNFPGKSPHVAHNTFITFSANSGIPSGLLYLYLFWCSFKMHRKVKELEPKDSIYLYTANSSLAALAGFFVGAVFLDMVIFEPFYYLIMLLSATYFVAIKTNKKLEPENKVLEKIDVQHRNVRL